MSNERTANGGHLTRAMHKAAAALYSATVLGGGSDRGADDERERADELARSESTVADSQAPEAQQEGKFELNATRLFLTYPQCNTPGKWH